MASLKQFKLPDLGEGLTEGEILKWLVQPGDPVTLNQPIVEVETAKAAVEVPSPYAGVVTEIHYGEGETVDVGTPIITFDVAADADAGSVATPSTEPPAQSPALKDDLVPDIPAAAGDEAIEPGLIGGPAPGGRTSVLVGYGPRQTSATRRPRKAAPAASTTAATARGKQHSRASARATASAAELRVGRATGAVAVLAKPPVRKLARDLGVDLTAIVGSGPGGTITRADIEGAAAAVTVTDRGTTAPALSSVPAFDPATREQRIPIKGVRKHTAAAVSSSAFTAPHVTEF